MDIIVLHSCRSALLYILVQLFIGTCALNYTESTYD